MAQSTFGQLIENLRGAEEVKEERSNGPFGRISNGVALTMLALSQQKEATATSKHSYYDEASEKPAPKPALSLSELRNSIKRSRSIVELCLLRRAFARSWHPDRLQASEGVAAVSEMASANKLIDDAIDSLRRVKAR